MIDDSSSMSSDPKPEDDEMRKRERMKRHLLGNTRCVSDFEKLAEIGEGTYGTVFKARDK